MGVALSDSLYNYYLTKAFFDLVGLYNLNWW
nr:MAG TPA: hypothetical protein [Caudoviricetes sp.]